MGLGSSKLAEPVRAYREATRRRRLVASPAPKLRQLALHLRRRGLGGSRVALLRIRAFHGTDGPALKGRCVLTLQGHTSSVPCLVVLPGGVLASGSDDKTVRLWQGGECVGTLLGHTSYVRCLAVLPNGVLASGPHDRAVRLWHRAAPACTCSSSRPLAVCVL